MAGPSSCRACSPQLRDGFHVVVCNPHACSTPEIQFLLHTPLWAYVFSDWPRLVVLQEYAWTMCSIGKPPVCACAGRSFANKTQCKAIKLWLKMWPEVDNWSDRTYSAMSALVESCIYSGQGVLPLAPSDWEIQFCELLKLEREETVGRCCPSSCCYCFFTHVCYSYGN